METYHHDIVACYLYVITRYGYPPDAEGTPVHLGEMKRLGFRSVELEGIHEEHLLKMHGMRSRIRSEAEGMGLDVPVFCTVLPGLSSPFDEEREKNLELFALGCEAAEELGATCVLDNSPLPPWQFPEGIPVTRHYDESVLAEATLPEGLQWNRYWDGLVKTYRAACDIAAGKGLTYQLHPCHGALVDTTDAYLLFSAAVGRDNLRFNLDTANQFFLKDNLFLSLLRLEGHVDYVHISDNGGEKMEHLVPGRGRINWDRFFEMLDRTGFSGKFGIDVGGAESGVDDLETAYRQSARWLQESWFVHKTK
ncbi:MAG: sugar phosphate isomerase/epimerase family protein [Bacteroidales bacterium]